MAWRILNSGMLLVVATSVIGFAMPLSMPALSFQYIIIYYTFMISLPFILLVFTPRVSFLRHSVPIVVCIALSVIQWLLLYSDSKYPDVKYMPLLEFVVFPAGMFLASYIFFVVTLRARQDGTQRRERF